MKTVAQIIKAKSNHNVHTVGPYDTVLQALEIMAEKNVGALPVVENGHVVGIISERDYARKGVLQGRSSVGTKVSDIMSTPVVTVGLRQTIRECMMLVTERYLRHLPVMDGEKLVGLLSIGDIVKETIAEQDLLIQQLEQYIRGE